MASRRAADQALRRLRPTVARLSTPAPAAGQGTAGGSPAGGRGSTIGLLALALLPVLMLLALAVFALQAKKVVAFGG